MGRLVIPSREPLALVVTPHENRSIRWDVPIMIWLRDLHTHVDYSRLFYTVCTLYTRPRRNRRRGGGRNNGRTITLCWLCLQPSLYRPINSWRMHTRNVQPIYTCVDTSLWLNFFNDYHRNTFDRQAISVYLFHVNSVMMIVVCIRKPDRVFQPFDRTVLSDWRKTI